MKNETSEFGDPVCGVGFATVHVIGGGVTGLTAAHKLAHRGFQVFVLEKDRCFDEKGHEVMALGGIARSQFAPAPLTPDENVWKPDPSWQRRAADSADVPDLGLFPPDLEDMLPVRMKFDPGGTPTKESAEALRRVIAALGTATLPRDVRVIVRGYADVLTGAPARAAAGKGSAKRRSTKDADDESILAAIRACAERVTKTLRGSLPDQQIEQMSVGPWSLVPADDLPGDRERFAVKVLVNVRRVVVPPEVERHFPLAIPFAPGRDVLSREGMESLEKLARDCRAWMPSEFRIFVTAYADARRYQEGDVPEQDIDDPRTGVALSHRRGNVVFEALQKFLRPESGSPKGLANRVHVFYQGERSFQRVRDGRDPIEAARLPPEVDQHNRWVVVTLAPVLLPGEHGFRFFPSYYRHVFETMSETPLLDKDGSTTGFTVLDEVVATPNQGVISTGASPMIFPRSPPESGYERMQQLRDFLDLGYDARDLLQFLVRIYRYMATCSARRAAEFEDISWWDFLEGRDGAWRTLGAPRYTYSPQFTESIKSQSQMLAAFKAEMGDARTCGNTYVQLFHNWIKQLPRADGTLDGPTSRAWFDPWRDYLRSIGVVFVPADLEKFSLDEQNGEPRLGAKVRYLTRYWSDKPPRAPDYYVLATDVVSAEEVTRDLPAVGALRNLRGYTTRVRDEEGHVVERDPHRSVGLTPLDRLQPATGIQFFFACDVKINAGYVYFSESEWGLTSINAPQFWSWKPYFASEGYTSVLSLDIFDFDGRSREGPVAGKTLPECTRTEIAEEVWRQVAVALKAEERELPQPTWFHIDDLLVFDAAGKLAYNRVPYLVPIKGDWKNRPGADPWDPTPLSVHLTAEGGGVGDRTCWRAKHGGYEVHFDKLVLAGTHMKTFMRMTTMESANESARHAVNAIIDHWLYAGPRPMRGAATPDDPDRETGVRQHMNSRTFYRTTPIGDYCRIWDPERNELPEMVPLKQLDEKLFAMGLPHVFDVLGIETIPTLLELMPAPPAPGAYPAAGAPGYPNEAARRVEEAITEHLRRLRQSLDETIRRAKGGDT